MEVQNKASESRTFRKVNSTYNKVNGTYREVNSTFKGETGTSGDEKMQSRRQTTSQNPMGRSANIPSFYIVPVPLAHIQLSRDSYLGCLWIDNE